jgi:tellurite resistance protein TerC
MERFHHVKKALVFILAYVGVKMLLSHHYKIPNLLSLAVIAGALAVGVLASLRAPRSAGSG